MPGTSIGSTKQLMEQPSGDLSKVMAQLSVTADDKTSTPPKNLSDMPFDVVGLIIERSDYKEQLLLRKTSKSLRTLVDKQQPACSRLSMSCMFDCIICNYNNHCVAYVSPYWNHGEFSSNNNNYSLDKIVSVTNYEKVAFDDLACTLENPKLQLEYFSFESEDFDDYYEELEYYEELYNFGYGGNRNWENRLERMQEILKSLKPKVSVKEYIIDVSNPSNAKSILPYLKPGVLEKIKVWDSEDWSPYSSVMEQVARLEQWKQAKELEVGCRFDEYFPVEHATHFKRFQLNAEFLDPDTLALIRDYILKHENAEFCSILDPCLHAKFFNGLVGTPVSPGLSHYTVPNSKYYLEFKIEEKRITIEKKKKQ